MDVEKHVYKDVVAAAASISTIIQFLSGMLICQNFVKKGSTGECSGVPFISGAVSTSLWLRYGFLINDSTMILVNTVGATLFFAYSVIFILFSIKKSSVLRQYSVALIFLVFVLSYSFKYESVDPVGVIKLMGRTCCGVTIFFFAAPLANFVHVVRTRSTETLPYPLILTTLLVSSLWFVYGIIIDDFFVQFPNFMGCILATIQLVPFCIFSNNNKYKLLEA